MTVTTVTMTAQPHWLHSHQQFELITLFRLLASPQTLVLGKQVPEFGLPQLFNPLKLELQLQCWHSSTTTTLPI